ncbi:MAG: hypothetical protein DMF71_05910, partial [Acidobacteria bacterium]
KVLVTLGIGAQLTNFFFEQNHFNRAIGPIVLPAHNHIAIRMSMRMPSIISSQLRSLCSLLVRA